MPTGLRSPPSPSLARARRPLSAAPADSAPGDAPATVGVTTAPTPAGLISVAEADALLQLQSHKLIDLRDAAAFAEAHAAAPAGVVVNVPYTPSRPALVAAVRHWVGRETPLLVLGPSGEAEARMA
eukprot:EG_transcript_35028